MVRRRIAAVVTEYRPLSHADVVLGKFLRGFPCDDGMHSPRVEIASIYLDQVNATDIGVATAAEFDIPIYPSIMRALTLGGEELDVDGVLIIGEHGDYPLNEKGQKLYPRRHFFEQVTGVLASSGRSVPIFTDKHLSYNWCDALWIYERAKELDVPLMAGSSLPVCWRRPFVVYPVGAPIDAAVVIGYGPIESYGFHALETMQCMVERRRGGETGVAAVQCLESEAVWGWLAAHDRYAGLARSAAETIGGSSGAWERVSELVPDPAAFLVTYRDGLMAVVLMLNGYCRSFAFAGQAGAETSACEFVLQSDGPHAHFSYLSLNIEEMYETGRPTYPVQRTLLTSGALAAAMDSRHGGNRSLETPHLEIAYEPVESVPFRPVGPQPSGATLEPWPPGRQD